MNKLIDDAIREIVNDIDFTDGSHAYEEVRAGVENVVRAVLRRVRDSEYGTTGSAVWAVAAELGLDL